MLFQNGGLDITTALIYDAVHLFARAIHDIDNNAQVMYANGYHAVKHNKACDLC